MSQLPYVAPTMHRTMLTADLYMAFAFKKR